MKKWIYAIEVSVYADYPVAKKDAMEKALALQMLTKL